jgi:hypothetical protein
MLVPFHSLLNYKILEQFLNSTVNIKVVKLPSFLFVGMVSRVTKDEY